MLNDKHPLFFAIFVFASLFIVGCSEQPAMNTQNAQAGLELQQVTLSVPGMDCPMCPVTVRRALNNVDGVTEVEATLETKLAVVRYDPGRVSVDDLIAATTNAGFPSSLKE